MTTASVVSGVEQPSVQTTPVPVLVEYLQEFIPALLRDDSSVKKSFQTLLEDPGQQEKMQKFIADPQVKSLLIQRTSVKGMLKPVRFIVNP